MKSLNLFIIEKLSLKDKINYSISKMIGINPVLQDEYLKKLKKFINTTSDGEVSCIIKTVDQISKSLDNCINRKELLPSRNGDFTVESGIKNKIWWNDIKLKNNTPFVCLYSVNGDKDKYYILTDSPAFLEAKDEKGNRRILGGLELETNKDILIKLYGANETNSFGVFLMGIYKYVKNPDLFDSFISSNSNKEKMKKEIELKIDKLEKELEKYK